MTAADVVIVGGGIEGCAAAWALSQRGVTDVVICERNTIGSGGTGKSSGVVRCHYGVSSLAAMATISLELFEQADDILGAPVDFQQTGYIVGVGADNVPAFEAALADQRAVGVQTETIEHDEVAKLWPQAYLDDFAAFAYEPRGGYGDAYATAQAFSTAARRKGATLRQGNTVSAILVDGGRVSNPRAARSDGVAASRRHGCAGPNGVRACGVRLADGSTIGAAAVVVAAGPWSVPLVAAHGIELPIVAHREQLVLIDPGTDLGPVPVLSDLVALQYVRPEMSGQLLFGNSDLSVIEPADPDRYVNRADAAFLELAVGKLAHRFPGLPDASVVGSYAGCYDVTPDFNPVISSTPIEGLVIAAGFSGHGFKIAPAVGELVADLVLGSADLDPRVSKSDFRLSRFADGDLLRSPHPYVGAGEMR